MVSVEVCRGRERPVEIKNRFEALDDEVEIGYIGIEAQVEHVAAVGVEAGILKSAGRGKITIDSGAAEPVLPVDLVPNETLVEGEAKRRGVKYVTANGGRMENKGEKKVRFRRDGAPGVNIVAFQLAGVGRPLASVILSVAIAFFRRFSARS